MLGRNLYTSMRRQTKDDLNSEYEKRFNDQVFEKEVEREIERRRNEEENVRPQSARVPAVAPVEGDRPHTANQSSLMRYRVVDEPMKFDRLLRRKNQLLQRQLLDKQVKEKQQRDMEKRQKKLASEALEAQQAIEYNARLQEKSKRKLGLEGLHDQREQVLRAFSDGYGAEETTRVPHETSTHCSEENRDFV